MDFDLFIFSGRVVSVDPGRTKDHRAYKKFRIKSKTNGNKSVFNSFVIWGHCDINVGYYIFVIGSCHEYTCVGDTTVHVAFYVQKWSISETDALLKMFNGIREPDARKDTLEEVTIPDYCTSEKSS